jgi:hypothetical protein
MNEKKFCICATTAVGTIGGIILAPAIGPLALGLPVLMGLFGKKMADVSDLEETQEIKPASNRQARHINDFSVPDENMPLRKIGPSAREALSAFHEAVNGTADMFLPVAKTKSKNSAASHQQKLKGARGIPDNEAWIRRHAKEGR